MKINRKAALRLWEERYGNRRFVDDFHGYLMCKEGFGNADFYVVDRGMKIYCGWNIHHILPQMSGGTNAKKNLICTNIATNCKADNKITYWIDDCLYQVRRVSGTDEYDIYKIN